MYKLSKRSLGNINSCHKDLQLIVREALNVSQIDFAITEGNRSIERQLELYNDGKSKIDGVDKLGKHNYSPSLAFDFLASIPGKPELAYDMNHLMYLVGVFTAIGEYMYRNGITTHRVRSGANWNRDGELIYDQTFIDAPHMELIKG
jgi:peptidoglycan L-alanyl-D-glutamate endopeptidase CwlK